MRLPTLGEGGFASRVGAFTEIIDRVEAFVADVVAIQAAANYLRRYPSGLGFRLRASPIGDIPTDGSDVEVFLLYSAQGSLEREGLAMGAGLGGRWFITSSEDLGADTFHQLVFYGSYEIDRFRPGLRFALPLDDDTSEIMELVFGLTVAIALD